jgi:hypothetical protein
MPAAQNAVINAVAASEIGKASGAFNMFRFLGGAFGIAILVAVFDHVGGLSSPQAFSSGFAHGPLRQKLQRKRMSVFGSTAEVLERALKCRS